MLFPLSHAPAARRARPQRFACILLVALLSGGATASAGQAPQPIQESRDFEVKAGPLGDVLAEFAAQAGVALSFDATRLAGARSPGLRGRYTLQGGFAALLSGSGYELDTRSNGYSLKKVSSASSDITQLDTVNVEARAIAPENAPYRTAGSSSYIGRDEIERFRGTSIGDIFQGTPGVLVGENRNSGGLDINIRGMQGQGRVPILVDGARQETTVYRGYAGVASRSYIDPDLISGIQINKGPATGAEGMGATGGVVAMTTLTADDIVQAGATSGVRMRGSLYGNSSAAPAPGTISGIGGLGTYRSNCAVPSLCAGAFALPQSFGSADGMDRPGALDFYSYAVSVAAAKRFESLDLVAAFSQRRQGNYYAGTHGPAPQVSLSEIRTPFYNEVTASYDGATRFRAGERVVNSNNESNSQLLKGKLYLPQDQTLELSYLRYSSRYGELMPSQLIWLDRVKQTENSEVTAHTLSSRYRWNPTDNDWLDLSAGLWYTHTNTLNRSYSADIYEGLLAGGPPEPERYNRVGGDIGNTMSFRQWGEHKLAYGVAFQNENIGTTVTPGLANTATGRIGDRQEYSLYANWTWKPRPEWTFDYGLRYLNAKTDDGKPVVPTGSYQCATDSDGSCAEQVYVPSVYCVDGNGDGACDAIRYRTRNSGTVPTYSVTWEPWRNGVQFYARHAEALRMPSLFETTQGWSVQPALDVPLKPEHAVNREVGANFLRRGVWRSSDRMAGKLAYFRNRTDNYLTRTSPNAWEEGNQIFVMRNINNVKLRGLEATFEYDAGFAYTRLGGTRYNFIEVCHYGSYRREECNDYGVANSYFNNMIPPKWHASILLGTRWLDGKLDLGTRLTLMGKRNPTPEFNDDTARGFLKPVPWHAYTLVDIYASYRYSDRLSFDLNIDNLTDQYYLDALSLGLVPAPGRTARLSMTMSF